MLQNLLTVYLVFPTFILGIFPCLAGTPKGTFMQIATAMPPDAISNANRRVKRKIVSGREVYRCASHFPSCGHCLLRSPPLSTPELLLPFLFTKHSPAHLKHSLETFLSFPRVLVVCANASFFDLGLDILPSTAERGNLRNLLELCLRTRYWLISNFFLDADKFREGQV